MWESHDFTSEPSFSWRSSLTDPGKTQLILVKEVVALAFLIRFLEIETTRDVNGAVSGFAYTKLRNDKTYVTVYTLWFRLIATAVVPFLLMLFCNVGIIFYYRKNR